MKLFGFNRNVFILLCLLLTFQLSTSFSQNIPSFLGQVSRESQYQLPQISSSDIDALVQENRNSFAYPFFVDIDVISQSSSFIFNDTVYYSLSFVSPHAYSLNIIFEEYHVPQGAELYVSNPQKTDIAGPYSYMHNSAERVLPTPLIPGDTICVLYKEPCNASFRGSIRVSQVSHDFTHKQLGKTMLKAEAQSCNVNINCAEGQDWQNEKRAVLKLIISGSSICTGTLMNNTAQDLTPYVLTANHCLNSNTAASKTVFYFGYEYGNCEGTGTLVTSKTISGASLVATSSNNKIDYTLLKMQQIPPKSYRPYFAGWDIRSTHSAGTVCIHHPRGDAKKISIDIDMPQTSSFITDYYPLSHWRIANWEVGTTESGSSGSPLFNSNHLVIGTLSGGKADCINPIDDYFSKISWAWSYENSPSASLQFWLNPLLNDTLYCAGFDPLLLPSNIMTNIFEDNNLNVYDFASEAQGLWTSGNDIDWTAFAEKFSSVQSVYVYAISLAGIIDTLEDVTSINISVWNGVDNPVHKLYSTSLSEHMFQDSTHIIVEPSTPIEVSGNFWVGIEHTENSKAFIPYMTVHSDGFSSMYIKYPQTWLASSEIGVNASLAVQLYVTTQPDTLPSILDIEKPFFVSQISPTVTSLTPKKLFGVDSLKSIRDTTYMAFVYSQKNISDWSGPNEIQANCFSNTYQNTSPVFIRSVKLAVRELPSAIASTSVYVWNSDFTQVLGKKTISNALLQAEHYNQVHFDAPIPYNSSYAVGVCFDSSLYANNAHLYMYYDVFTKIDGMFSYNNQWFAYRDFDVPYNVALEPIFCFSSYHYNKDFHAVQYYPIENIWSKELAVVDDVIVFPNPVSDQLIIQFEKTFYNLISVSLYSSYGVFISTHKLQLKNGRYELSLQDLPQGMYIVKIDIGTKVFTKKIVKIASK